MLTFKAVPSGYKAFIHQIVHDLKLHDVEIEIVFENKQIVGRYNSNTVGNVIWDQRRYHIRIAAESEEIDNTIAHELRHVWQFHFGILKERIEAADSYKKYAEYTKVYRDSGVYYRRRIKAKNNKTVYTWAGSEYAAAKVWNRCKYENRPEEIDACRFAEDYVKRWNNGKNHS